nr:MAG TPA: hypothetical protein [Caudoviricetes sp.]
MRVFVLPMQPPQTYVSRGRAGKISFIPVVPFLSLP